MLYLLVIAGLGPAIQGGRLISPLFWMPGSSPGMTQTGDILAHMKHQTMSNAIALETRGVVARDRYF